jgi:outer membrane protein OmpA-like peptidoglycan-associated protein
MKPTLRFSSFLPANVHQNGLLTLLLCFFFLPLSAQEYSESDLSEMLKREKPYQFMYRFVSQDLQEPIEGASVKIVEKESKAPSMTVTGKDGRVFIRLPADKTFSLRVSHPAYFTEMLDFDTKDGKNFEMVETIALERIILGATRKVENFYFYPNDTLIPAECMPHLERLYRLLRYNPELRLEIACHTDSRGDDAYNLELTQKRAEAIVRYLQSKGIAAERLVAKGYGETRLVNQCANDIKCTTREHEQNRRVEYTIIGI